MVRAFRHVWFAGMYEFDLVLLLLQQMCVFLVIAWLMSQNPTVYPPDASHRSPAAQAAVLRHLLHFLHYGTYFGLHIEDSIANTRAIGAVMGGLLGGPVVGGLVGLTGGLHRYSLGGMTALSCMVSTIVEGLLGGLVHSVLVKRGRPDKVFSPLTAGAITFVAELVQMMIILLIARPFQDALHLVQSIAAPMMVTNTSVRRCLCAFCWTSGRCLRSTPPPFPPRR
ncbi:autolysin sensor kinase [Klebsiella pneumoniae]|uniref:Autolysin sensor kinase n=1 Tax=Klebsiella pneumoniae TaxID=573 RepID=A0A2X3ISX5_KLEPN|nr:autolysin sensor kinase [Klebsiella pneumoniae]